MKLSTVSINYLNNKNKNMPQQEENMIKDHAAEWLASCGFIFPTNEKELERFRLLNGTADGFINGKEVDPSRIIDRSKGSHKKVVHRVAPVSAMHDGRGSRMVARIKKSTKKYK